MLEYLYVRDFAIVNTLELSFAAGLTVLTGETGAGKSILIDALALALGERADATVIRHGCTRTEISASFALKARQDATIWLKMHELDADDECVLRRVIETDKASKSFINGRPVPVQMLRELGELLVDIHGQHEHQSLVKREAQRQILDDYGAATVLAGQVAAQYRDLKSQQERLETLKQQSHDRQARTELIGYQVNELKALALEPGEIQHIEEEHRRLAHAAALVEGAQATAQVLYDDDASSVSAALAQTIGKLETLSRFDARMSEVAALLKEAAIQIDEAAGQLHHYLDQMEIDPARLTVLDERLSSIHDLARKHKINPEELPELLVRLSNELEQIENFDVNVKTIEDHIKSARSAYMENAQQLSGQRRIAAQKLRRAVTQRMQELGMGGGCFEVSLTELEPDEMGPNGLEQVEFLVSANPGQPLQPLAKVASGGEVSRIGLALQVVVAQLGRIPTLIFDEVDVGIGGRVAEIVGQQLRALGRSRQVLCITHLAQVAALGNQHIQTEKWSDQGNTEIKVRALTEKERVMEIARMMGGVQISNKTVALASDMLARAGA